MQNTTWRTCIVKLKLIKLYDDDNLHHLLYCDGLITSEVMLLWIQYYVSN